MKFLTVCLLFLRKSLGWPPPFDYTPSHSMLKVWPVTLWLVPLFLVMTKAHGRNVAPEQRTRSQPRQSDVNYSHGIVPLLEQYCFSCHGNGKRKGDLALDGYQDESAALAERTIWERVLKMVQDRAMPPGNKPQPTEQDRDLITKWIEEKVLGCDCEHPDPGRVTIRRLNRAEYNNTVRDLLGVQFQPAEDFPADDSGYGFDNIGDVLSMPPILLEKYMAAAERILDSALVLRPPMPSRREHFPVNTLEVGYNVKQRGDGWAALNSIEEDDVAANYAVPSEGDYVLRVRAHARQDSAAPIKLTFMLDQQVIQAVVIETNAAAPQIYETRFQVPAGKNRFRAVVRRHKEGLSEIEAAKWKSGREQKGTVFVEYLEIEGPLDSPQRALTETHRRIFGQPPSPGKEGETAREIIGRFARRAYRRPVAKEELTRLVELAERARKDGESFEQSVALALQAVLVSPHFLFRGELQPEPENPKAVLEWPPPVRHTPATSKKQMPISDRQPDRCDDEPKRIEGALRIGSGKVSPGREDYQGGNVGIESRESFLSWRLELHSPPQSDAKSVTLIY